MTLLSAGMFENIMQTLNVDVSRTDCLSVPKRLLVAFPVFLNLGSTFISPVKLL